MTAADAAYVQYRVENGFATLTLDSPHHRNALSTRLVTQLLDGFDKAGADVDVRGIVLTHTGTTFCAGADLSEAASPDPAAAAAERTRQMITLLHGQPLLPDRREV